MSLSRKRRLIAAVALIGALIGGASIAPASAACLSAEVYTRSTPTGTKQYVVGPKRCLVSTPYAEAANAGEDVSGVPGNPGFRVWVPSPVAP